MARREPEISLHGFVGLILGVCAVGIVGCSSQQPAAAHLSRMQSEPREDLLLSSAEQSEVIAAMKTVAIDHTPSQPRPFVREMRWSDLPAAVSAACDQPGVEMVIVQQEQVAWGTVFHLRTVEDRPAMLEVRRRDDERLYEARAMIGHFNLAKDEARANLLLQEVDRAMERYAKKKRLPEESPTR